MLECVDIACARGGRPLFQNLSFTAKRGSVTLISGQNGSGKTTLLRAMVGLLPTLNGSVKFQGEEINLSSSCLSHLTYVGHKNACSDRMTVMDNLMFWANCKGTEQLVLAALCFFGLQPVLELKYKDLSAGWKRRVALSRLLISNTKVWIIDEPFANLDSSSIDLVQGLILTRASQGGIVVLTDHIAHTKFADAQVINIEAYHPSS